MRQGSSQDGRAVGMARVPESAKVAMVQRAAGTADEGDEVYCGGHCRRGCRLRRCDEADLQLRQQGAKRLRLKNWVDKTGSVLDPDSEDRPRTGRERFWQGSRHYKLSV